MEIKKKILLKPYHKKHKISTNSWNIFGYSKDTTFFYIKKYRLKFIYTIIIRKFTF